MRDGKPIEILHIVGTRPVGGIGALLKNINTSIDLNKFHFTYVFSADSNIGDFDNYVRKLGSDWVFVYGNCIFFICDGAKGCESTDSGNYLRNGDGVRHRICTSALKRDPDSQGTGRRSGDTWNCILFVPAQ